MKFKLTIILFLITLLISSCGVGKYSNFSKQKFTDLKSVSSTDITKGSVESATSKPFPTDTSTSSACDTLWLKSGKILECTILSDNGSEIKFSDCPPSAIVSTIAKSATKLSPADSIWQANHPVQCDTIYLKGGEKMLGQVQYGAKRKLVYKGCCKECTVQKTVLMKTVDSVYYVNGKPKGPNVQVPTTVKEEVPKVHYTDTEKSEFAKKKKLFGWLGLSAGSLSLISFIIFAAVSTASIAFGFVFFILVIAAIAFAVGYSKNKRKLSK